ncbi:MAG: sensor histidine kinase [Solirubrobacteraceae bacterium]
MRRLPITIRLTLTFAVVTAAVLAATGLFVYARLSAELDQSVTDNLRSRADDVAAFVRRGGGLSRTDATKRLTEVGESFSQIIDAHGIVVGGTRAIGRHPLLGPGALAQARDHTIMTDHGALPHWDEQRLRLLATPIAVGGEHLVAVVGMSLSDQQDALTGLIHHLLIGGPAALLLATLTAFCLARAALAPVESMRRRAAAISASETGRRLPVPDTSDELSRLGQTLNAMLERLEAALARERMFVVDAGHELRTPLTILKTELELAMRHGHSTRELRDTIASAAEETDRLVTIAEDLLALARTEHRGPNVPHEPADVAELLERVAARFRAAAERAGRALEADAPAGLTVTVDRPAIERALGNMLDNALRHGEGAVRAVAVVRDARVELHVLDEGSGFPEHFRAHAFERFSRADVARTRGGSGLGLAVVQGVAAAHGGSAEVARTAGRGADVSISLPLTDHAAAATPGDATAGGATADGTAAGGLIGGTEVIPATGSVVM